MSKEQFLLLVLAIAFYNTGTIWAMEVDIFRSWRVLEDGTFSKVQTTHWRKLPYWVFIPVGCSFMGTIALFWYHPANISTGEIWLALLIQLLSHIITAAFWGPLQAKLSKDPAGGKSSYLQKILKTHWVRTALITGYAMVILHMVWQLF